MQVWTKMLHKAKFIIAFACSSCLLPHDSAGKIARALVNESGDFLCQHHSIMVLHAHISPGV
jgi:hypothetical protein